MFRMTHNQIPRNVLYKIYTTRYNVYTIMLLPTDKWTLVLANIPELLLWIIFLCVSLAVCLSKITASENELYLTLCTMYIAIMFQCVLSIKP